MKFLFYGTHPLQTNGYAKIANRLTNYLAEKGVEVYHFAITNYGNEIERFVHPKITILDCFKNNNNDPFGYDWIGPTIEKIKPDIVFLYNDILVLNQVVARLPQPKLFQLHIYIDLVYRYEKIDLVQNLCSQADKLFTFSECWTKNLIEMKADPKKIYLFTNGIDTHHLPFQKSHFGLNDNDWVVLNTNRNTHRKALDLTISSFICLLSKIKAKQMDYHRVKLFLNHANEQTSYDIPEMIKVQAMKYKWDLQSLLHHIILPKGAGRLTDQMVLGLYKVCDIGLNTCFGEGLGLCNLEHGSLGKPQVVTSTGALIDIFGKNFSSMLVQPKAKLYIPNNMDYHGGYIDICTAEDYASRLFYFYCFPEEGKKLGERLEVYLRKTYDWKNILYKFYQDLVA